MHDNETGLYTAQTKTSSKLTETARVSLLANYTCIFHRLGFRTTGLFSVDPTELPHDT